MQLKEFLEQDAYCREHNVPGGTGCDECPTQDKLHCADALHHLCAQWLKSEGEGRKRISEELHRYYNISPFNQLGLLNGVIELKS